MQRYKITITSRHRYRSTWHRLLAWLRRPRVKPLSAPLPPAVVMRFNVLTERRIATRPSMFPRSFGVDGIRRQHERRGATPVRLPGDKHTMTNKPKQIGPRVGCLVVAMIGIATIFLYAFIAQAAWAGGERPQVPSAESDAHASAAAGAKAGAHAQGSGTANVNVDAPHVDIKGPELNVEGDTVNTEGGNANAAGGDATGGDATGGNATGASSTTSYESQFFALSRNMPQGHGCFGPVDGGGAGDGGGGFLGFFWLNGNCWMDHLAKQEASLELRTRLACGGRRFRNAVGYDAPKKNQRHARCLQVTRAEYQKQIDLERAAGGELLALQTKFAELEATADELRRNNEILLEERTHERRICDERVERCTRALRGEDK